jgi:hypothetical protein
MSVQAQRSGSRCQADALSAIDKVLEDQTDSIDHALVPAIQCLVRLRDETIAAVRASDADAADQKRLHDVNAALSLLVGTHYPLVGIKWNRLKKARDALAEVMPRR